jgi:hypothetical protein
VSDLESLRLALRRVVEGVSDKRRPPYKALYVRQVACHVMDLLDEYVAESRDGLDGQIRDLIYMHAGVSRGDRVRLIKAIAAKMDELEAVVGRDALAEARAAVDRFVPIVAPGSS